MSSSRVGKDADGGGGGGGAVGRLGDRLTLISPWRLLMANVPVMLVRLNRGEYRTVWSGRVGLVIRARMKLS